jgi:hypothetical protein
VALLVAEQHNEDSQPKSKEFAVHSTVVEEADKLNGLLPSRQPTSMPPKSTIYNTLTRTSCDGTEKEIVHFAGETNSELSNIEHDDKSGKMDVNSIDQPTQETNCNTPDRVTACLPRSSMEECE